MHRPTGTAVEEIVVTGTPSGTPDGARLLQRPLLRGGEPVPELPTLEDARTRLREGLGSVPWEGLTLSRGEPAIPTRVLRAEDLERGGAPRRGSD